MNTTKPPQPWQGARGPVTSFLKPIISQRGLDHGAEN